MKPSLVISAVLALAGSVAAAPRVTITPKLAHPGDAVLVSVLDATEVPTGHVNGGTLEFFRAKAGYQAVIAIPLDSQAETLKIEVDEKPYSIPVKLVNFKETDVVVEDELANPDAAQRAQIDADNAAIIAAVRKGNGEAQFTAAFRRPPGEVTSPFGEWRTFNDGHKSQHLGLDLFAREGSAVRAANAGTVTLVRDCFLSGTTVVVAHGGGIATAYYHLSRVDVAEGDTVERGAQLGAAGHTGRTTGPHLHISVRVPGGWADPAEFFKLPIAPAAPTTARR